MEDNEQFAKTLDEYLTNLENSIEKTHNEIEFLVEKYEKVIDNDEKFINFLRILLLMSGIVNTILLLYIIIGK